MCHSEPTASELDVAKIAVTRRGGIVHDFDVAHIARPCDLLRRAVERGRCDGDAITSRSRRDACERLDRVLQARAGEVGVGRGGLAPPITDRVFEP
jgi:hypothetical protein